MDSKDKQIEELKALVAELTKRVSELELELAKARRDSQASRHRLASLRDEQAWAFETCVHT